MSDPVLMRELLAFLQSHPEAAAVEVSEDDADVAESAPPCPWPRHARRWESDRSKCRWRR